jgi:hypothetical protein
VTVGTDEIWGSGTGCRAGICEVTCATAEVAAAWICPALGILLPPSAADATAWTGSAAGVTAAAAPDGLEAAAVAGGLTTINPRAAASAASPPKRARARAVVVRPTNIPTHKVAIARQSDPPFPETACYLPPGIAHGIGRLLGVRQQ